MGKEAASARQSDPDGDPSQSVEHSKFRAGAVARQNFAARSSTEELDARAYLRVDQSMPFN